MDPDIMDVIATMIGGFRSLDLELPAAILLKSHEDGMRLLSEIRQQSNWAAHVYSPELGRCIELADGSRWMEVMIMDVAVRWPANRITTPDGSWAWT